MTFQINTLTSINEQIKSVTNTVKRMNPKDKDQNNLYEASSNHGAHCEDYCVLKSYVTKCENKKYIRNYEELTLSST